MFSPPTIPTTYVSSLWKRADVRSLSEGVTASEAREQACFVSKGPERISLQPGETEKQSANQAERGF
jgi:hypothetical protein